MASTAKRVLPVVLPEPGARSAFQELHLQPAHAELLAQKATAAAVPIESVPGAARA